METVGFLRNLLCLTVIVLGGADAVLAGDSCNAYPTTVNIRCSVDTNAFARAVREKVIADMRASGDMCNSSVRVQVRRKGQLRKAKPYEEILSGFVVSDVNADPLHGVTVTGTANSDIALERCSLPVDVTVTVVVRTSGNYFEKRTTSRIEIPGVFIR